MRTLRVSYEDLLNGVGWRSVYTFLDIPGEVPQMRRSGREYMRAVANFEAVRERAGTLGYSI